MSFLPGAKIILGGETLIDLTGDTVRAEDLRDGVTAHDKSGAQIIGSLDVDVTVTNFSVSVSLISGDDYKITITS